jgi:hypothetical protein
MKRKRRKQPYESIEISMSVCSCLLLQLCRERSKRGHVIL